jgi:myo-inositol-1(or 4)-monophosphatase
MSRYYGAVRPLVERAGHLAQELRAQGIEHHIKPDGTPVTSADVAVSEFLTQELLAAFPDTRVISEESSDRSGVTHALTWAIDPIDGTKKYLAGKPVWCVMVGLFDIEPVFGMIYYPDLAVWYWAERGLGAWMEDADGRRELILPSPEDPLRVAHAPECGLRYGELSSHGYMKHVRKIIWGKLDVYLRSCVGYYDLVAPAIILTEAGGVVTDFHGRPILFNAPDGVARDVLTGRPAAIARVLNEMKRSE